MQIKSILLSSCLFAFMSLAAVAQESKDPAPAVGNPNASEMTFENEMHDYGTIKQGADGSCEFKFTNTGKEPIMKGQTGVIKVHYDTKRVGAFTKTVTIESNAKSNPRILTIKGIVEASDVANEITMPLKKVETGATPLAK